MINKKQLINSIRNQPSNSFVSRHINWGRDFINVKAIDEPLSGNKLDKIIKILTREEKIFLNSIANKHKNPRSFLKDPDINPAPDMAPKWTKLPKKNSIKMTVECLPIKSQNPYKTISNTPDLGEIACLIHFQELAEVISEHFNIDFRFVLLIEARVFGRLFEISDLETKQFDLFLQKMADRVIKNGKLELVDWGKKLNSLPNFWYLVNKQKKNLESLIKKGNKKIINELLIIFPTIYMSIKPKGHSVRIFQNFSDGSIDVDKHLQRAKNITLNIMAFNRARKLCKERRKLFPGFLKGTLTPAKEKWSFYAIGPWNNLYPHHGIGIFNDKYKRVTISYISDLIEFKRNNIRLKWYKWII